MIIDKEDGISIVFRENASIAAFLVKLEEAYPGLRNDNLIINLISFTELSAGDILLFQELAARHTSNNKSFVMVTSRVSYDEVPEDLNIVPTVQEARDLIEMDEIERDLEL